MTASHTPDDAERPADLFSVSANPHRRAPAGATPPAGRAPAPSPAPPADRPEPAAAPSPQSQGVPAGPPAHDASPVGASVAVVPAAMPGAAVVPAAAGGSTSLAPAVPNLAMSIDPFAVATRAVLVLIGSLEPAQHIARAAIGSAIDNDSSAAIDVVVPRAVDLVLRRAAHLVSIGAGPKVVDHYTERLDLWRRLACRSGLEPAAIALSLAPFPPASVAAMLRVDVEAVNEALDRWYSGIDPEKPAELGAGTSVTGAEAGAGVPVDPTGGYGSTVVRPPVDGVPTPPTPSPDGAPPVYGDSNTVIDLRGATPVAPGVAGQGPSVPGGESSARNGETDPAGAGAETADMPPQPGGPRRRSRPRRRLRT